MARSLPVENLLPQNVGSIINTCSNVLKQHNGELLVAVNHNQLRTMASETVDPIDWSHSPPSWAAPPELHVHSINQCNLSGTRTCNHLAYAAYVATRSHLMCRRGLLVVLLFFIGIRFCLLAHYNCAPHIQFIYATISITLCLIV